VHDGSQQGREHGMHGVLSSSSAFPVRGFATALSLPIPSR
jgi:hypothetical protein